MILPPGRLKLVTTPALTGSAALTKTIGMVAVAAFATLAGSLPPVATITATLRSRSSPAKLVRRSYCPFGRSRLDDNVLALDIAAGRDKYNFRREISRGGATSGSGQKQKWLSLNGISALPSTADMPRLHRHVGFVPEAVVTILRHCGLRKTL